MAIDVKKQAGRGVRPRRRPAVKKALKRLSALGRRLWAQWPRAAACAAGFAAAGAPVLGGLHPMGLALAAALPGPAGLWAAAGAAAGCGAAGLAQAPAYWLGLGAVALAALAQWAGRRALPPFTGAAAGALCQCTARSALLLAAGAGLNGVLAAGAEALLALGMCYVLAGFFAAVPRELARADTAQQAGAALAVMMALAAAAPWQVWGLSPARAAAGALVLAGAWRRGLAGACTAAAAAGAALCAAVPDAPWVAPGLAAGALAAGLFFGEGRPLTAGVFCGAGALGALCAGSAGPGLLWMVELAAGGALFCLAPRRWLERLPAAGQTARPASDGALAPHLQRMGGALGQVGRTVQAVCAAYARPPAGSAGLADAVADSCCARCGRRNVCWVEYGFDTYDAFARISRQVEQGQWVQAETLPDALKRRCTQPVTLAGAVNAAAAARVRARDAWQSQQHVRAALCQQYDALSEVLAALAAQAGQTVQADPLRARRVRQMMREAGFEPLDAGAYTDARGRLSLWVTLPPAEFTRAELDTLTAEAAALCRCPLAPCRAETGQATTLTWRQAPRYAARFGVCSLPAAGDISADAVRTCAGEWLCAVLCDGMGTGKAAAVDGALAAKLCEQLLAAGFPPAQTARLVNVAMGLKGGDEAATTLDLLRADPCTGRALLYKAGAAPSFVLRAGSGQVETLMADTVPVGILARVIGRQTELELAAGDTVVLVSDGALAPGLQGLAALLAAHRHRPPDALARAVARAAREAAGRPDDVTVAVLRLEERQP